MLFTDMFNSKIDRKQNKVTCFFLNFRIFNNLSYLLYASNEEFLVTKIAFVIDDEPANIELIKGLMPEGVKVKAALSGEVALKQLSKKMPDIVFLDLIMPQMDGFETLKAIRELPGGSSLPVLIISGNTNEADVEKGKALGAIGHLTKPIDSNKLAIFINQYL